jgi:pantetheine-phosphate adenylyltransferase
MKIGIFPGSFDPFTIGHENIALRALPLFDKLIIAIGKNEHKQRYYSIEQSMLWIKMAFENEPKIEVDSFEGLTVDYCKRKNAQFILRGLRTSADFEFEKAIAQMNKAMANEIETIFILPTPELSAINSTIIRDIVRNNGDASAFVPKGTILTKPR